MAERMTTRSLPGDTVSTRAKLALGVLLLLLLVAPTLIYPIALMKVLCFALFACSFNLVLGWPPELGLIAGTAVAAVMGLVIGWLAIRRQGIYFAMVTLALAQMIYFVALEAKFTHGEDGIQAVPRGKFLGFLDLSDTNTMYYFVLAIFAAAFWLIYRTIHSPFGQVLKAIRENEPRATSLGYRVDHYKLLAFTLSAALAGLAGSMKALVFQLASLTDVDWRMSGQVVLMTLVGGVGTVFGPLVGAFILVTMENYLAQFGSWVTVIQGLIFVVCVLTFRKGIVGEISELVRRAKGERARGGGGH